MTKLFEIASALESALKAISGLPARAAPNAPFKPKLGDPYVRDTLMPVEPSFGSIGIDGHNNPRGLYQIDIFYPENVATSTALAQKMADTITEAFSRGLLIETATGNKITIELSWTLAPRQIQGFYQIPVMVRWSVYGG